MATTTGDVNFYLPSFKEQGYETPFNAAFQDADTYITANNAIRATLSSINGFVVGNGAGGFTAKNLSALNGFIECNGSGTFTAHNLGSLNGFISCNGSGTFVAKNLNAISGFIYCDGAGNFSAGVIPSPNRVDIIYTPSAEYALTGSYATIPGSTVSFTPENPVNLVEYTFTCHAAGPSAQIGGMHLKLYRGETVVSSAVTRILPAIAGSVNEDTITFRFLVPGWTGTSTLTLRGRYYSAAITGSFHRLYFLDGGSSSQLVNAYVSVEEK